MTHRNASLTFRGRQILCKRIQDGRPVCHVAREMGISRATAHKWWRRYLAAGNDGLQDRSSRPATSPSITSPRLVRRIVAIRKNKKYGPFRIGAALGIPASTVHKVLVREELNLLSFLDRPTGEVIRRYERKKPGDLIHIDVKKLGRIPKGGGHRIHGREGHGSHRLGYDFLHVAVDDRSRLAYVEVRRNETAATAIEFLERACAFYRQYGVTTRKILTDNGPAYRSTVFNDALRNAGIRHGYTRPYRPQTNGKVERFNRTLAEEWAYIRPYTTNAARTRSLAGFVHRYNFHRAHSALGGKSPISRVNNVFRHYS